MAEYRLSYDPSGLRRFDNALERLGGSLGKKVVVRALNHQGAKAYTQVKRTLGRQMGVKYGVVNKAVKERRAFAGTTDGFGAKFEYRIIGTGEPLSLKHFGARQVKSGVSAAPWGKRRIFEKAFNTGGAFPGRKPVFGGHVFVRAGSKRFPIRKLYGPGVADEIVKGRSLEAFQRVFSGLAARLEHEISRVVP